MKSLAFGLFGVAGGRAGSFGEDGSLKNPGCESVSWIVSASFRFTSMSTKSLSFSSSSAVPDVETTGIINDGVLEPLTLPLNTRLEIRERLGVDDSEDRFDRLLELPVSRAGLKAMGTIGGLGMAGLVVAILRLHRLV